MMNHEEAKGAQHPSPRTAELFEKAKEVENG